MLRYSKAICIVAVVYLLCIAGSAGVFGLNWGIDFVGGMNIELSLPAESSEASLRAGVGKLKAEGRDVYMQNIGTSEYLVVLKTDGTHDDADMQAVKNVLRESIGDGIVYRRVDRVGPLIGRQMMISGVLSVLVALGGMFFYLLLRFDIRYAIGGVAALVHDVLVVIGFFVVSRMQFTVSSVAAILTVVGYSINDTVVIYDYVKNEMRYGSIKPNSVENIKKIVNFSMNKVLKRTILTSFTTLLSLSSLAMFNLSNLGDFVWASLLGLVAGTYSSIFIAPCFLFADSLFAKKPAKKQPIVASSTAS